MMNLVRGKRDEGNEDFLDPVQSADFEGVQDPSDIGRREAERKYVSKLVSQKIKDEWIREQMRKRREDYTVQRQLRVFIGTWNVNGKKPSEKIEAWLSVGASSRMPDLYVLGFQEMVDLTAGNVVMDSSSTERAKVWIETIRATLNRMYGGERYMCVTFKHLVGIMICIFVLDEHSSRVNRDTVQATVTATGVMGMGNKGGVSIRLQLYDSTFCFVCAHLAAHREAVDARNADFRNIMTKTTFKDYIHSQSQLSAEERLSCPADATQFLPEGSKVYRKNYEAVSNGTGNAQIAPFNGGNGESAEELNMGSLSLSPILSDPTFGIVDHDYVFWLGDFNYRISAEHSIDQVFSRIEANDLKWLRENDQLLLEQSAGRAFAGFKEGEIQFLPTYKFQTGTNQYDRRPDKKVRAPAYCDRILWRDVNESHARILKYISCPTLCSSDHKPVIALFETKVEERIPARRSEVFLEIIRQIDKWENDERPRVQIDRNAISFTGGLTYMEQRVERIVLSNVGQVPCAWRFVPKLEDRTISKRWIRPEPDFGLLTPGSSVEIKLVALVDGVTSRAISSGMEVLDDILVLRLENGQDHFICVSASLVPTCFGVGLNRLVRNHAPFAASAEEKELMRLDRIARMGEEKSKLPLKLPKELWWLCNFLWIYDLLKTPSIFVMSSRLAFPDKLSNVRRCIDSGHELVPEDHGHAMAHAVATVLIEFLDALPEPVVPFSLFPKVDVDNIAMDAWGRNFLDQLPSLSHNVFVYVITFLREVVKNQSYNRVNASDLASVFAQCLMRPAEAAERMRDTSPQTNMPFDLPNWITGEKKESTLSQLAEKVVLHFIQADRTSLF